MCVFMFIFWGIEGRELGRLRNSLKNPGSPHHCGNFDIWSRDIAKHPTSIKRTYAGHDLKSSENTCYPEPQLPYEECQKVTISLQHYKMPKLREFLSRTTDHTKEGSDFPEDAPWSESGLELSSLLPAGPLLQSCPLQPSYTHRSLKTPHPLCPQVSVLPAVQKGCFLLVCHCWFAITIDNAQFSSSSAWMIWSPLNTLRV